MSLQKEIIRILYIFAQQQKQLTITFGSLATLIQNYAQKFKKERPELLPLVENTAEVLPDELYQLEQGEYIKIKRGHSSQEIFSITYIGYYQAALKEWYKKMLDNPDMAFPSKTFNHDEIPEKSIVNIDIAEDFQNILRSDEIKDNALVNIHFENTISDILIVKQSLHGTLEDICFRKLQQFLQRGKNSIHLVSKLLKDKSIDSIANETIKNLAQKPSEERHRFQNPSNNYYHLWISICKLEKQQLVNTTTQNTTLEGTLQAVKILHEYISFYYAQKRKKQIQDRALQKISDTIKMPPYAHSISSLEPVQEDAEAHSSNVEITIETFREHLNKLTQPNRISSVPEIIQFKTINGNEYVMASEKILFYLHKEIPAAREKLNETLTTQIINDYNSNNNIELLKKNIDLEPTVEAALKNDSSILYSLLNFRIIEIGIMANRDNEHSEIVPQIVDQVNEQLLSYCAIMQITKEDLKKEVSYVLPVWALLPALAIIMRLVGKLLKIFTRKDISAPVSSVISASESDYEGDFAPPLGSQEHQPEQIITKRIVDMPQTSENASMKNAAKTKLEAGKKELKELLGQWNTIIDPAARKNLTQDVNSLSRDSLRIIWKGKGVPDGARVRELAGRISQNPQFDGVIQNKKALANYMEQYMNVIVYSSLAR